jgi:hypothetical protein
MQHATKTATGTTLIIVIMRQEQGRKAIMLGKLQRYTRNYALRSLSSSMCMPQEAKARELPQQRPALCASPYLRRQR